MTKLDEIAKDVCWLKKLLNEHLHDHKRLRFWLFTFLITTDLTLLGIIIALLK